MIATLWDSWNSKLNLLEDTIIGTVRIHDYYRYTRFLKVYIYNYQRYTGLINVYMHIKGIHDYYKDDLCVCIKLWVNGG